jgi:hypothetical protein
VKVGFCLGLCWAGLCWAVCHHLQPTRSRPVTPTIDCSTMSVHAVKSKEEFASHLTKKAGFGGSTGVGVRRCALQRAWWSAAGRRDGEERAQSKSRDILPLANSLVLVRQCQSMLI